MDRCRFCQTPNCTGRSTAELTANLARHGLLPTPSVRAAFAALDRACFQSRAPSPYLNPYVDGCLPPSPGQ